MGQLVPTLKGSVVTVKECFVMLHAYLLQSNDFSDLLLGTEVGHGKVAVVCFCVGVFLFHLCEENGEVPLHSNSCTMLLSIKCIKDLSISC